MKERLHFHFSLSCIGEGNGNPLQCSCLENPRVGGACWAAVYGVAQSRTRLKWLSCSSSFQMVVTGLTGSKFRDWCWSWSSNTLARRCEEPTHWKRPWCWGRLKAKEEAGWPRMRWLDVSPTQWTWIWVKFWEIAKDGKAVHGVAKSLIWLSDWTQRRQWQQPTPVLLPGKSHGRRGLVGCSPWGR